MTVPDPVLRRTFERTLDLRVSVTEADRGMRVPGRNVSPLDVQGLHVGEVTHVTSCLRIMSPVVSARLPDSQLTSVASRISW
jgi:hypothetical protein